MALKNMDARLANDSLLFYREGLQAVVRHEDPGVPVSPLARERARRSTGADISTQVFLGHLPMLWARRMRACASSVRLGVTSARRSPTIPSASR
jgi:hypothetical protein